MKTQIQTVETESFSMDYMRFGQGQKILVILPGLSVQSVMGFADAIADAYLPLTDDFTVYVPDRRKNLPSAYSVHEMARDTAEALRVLGLDRVNLFGASQGGMMAMVIAMEHPELVDKLVLGSTAARMEKESYRTVERWIRLAGSTDAVGLYLAFGEAVYPREVFEQSRELLAEAAGSVTGEDLRRFIILAEGMKDFDVTDRLETISSPVQVIGSKDDRVLGADASRLIAERLNGRAKLFLYDGYGHAAYDTAPDYKERIRDFLTADAG